MICLGIFNISVPFLCRWHLSVLLTVAVSVWYLSSILLFIFLPSVSLQPSASRSLYRNRSFLRIPLAARPRFSSLRSLRFVLAQSAKTKGMPHPPFPWVHVVPMLQCSWVENTEEQECKRRICDVFFFPPQERGLIFRLLVICMLQYQCLRKHSK